jgi:hypothetical protein
LLKQKAAKNVTIILGYFIFLENHIEPPKVAQLAKNRPIWSQKNMIAIEILLRP